MTSPSPTAEGFRAAFRRPAFTFAEIAWRWALGATATALFFFYGIEFLDTLPVSSGDSLLLSTRQPLLMGRAMEHILRGSLNRAVLGGMVAVLLLAVLWIVAASLGRLATMRAVLEYFRSDFPGIACDRAGADFAARTESRTKSDDMTRRPLRALIDLNFLRVAVVLAVMLALGGAAILASFVSSEKTPRPDLAVILFLLLAGLIFIAAWVLNWWLSFAGVFAVRDGEDAMGAVSEAATLARMRTGAVLAVSIWTGLAHLVAFSLASSAGFFLLAFIRIAPARLVLTAVGLVTLMYFAVADWLYIARLSGYVCIAEMPDSPLAVPPSPPMTSLGASNGLDGVIDRDESILSDVSSFALES